MLLLTLAGAGCSSSGTVSGKVTYKGEAVGGGTVLFVSEGRGSVSVQIGTDGTYTAEKVPTGAVQIAVETQSLKGSEPPPQATRQMPPAGLALPKEAENSPIYGSRAGARRYTEIPKKYSDPKTSGLTCTVSGGNQKHDIPLE
jgi:hypothetical protein